MTKRAQFGLDTLLSYLLFAFVLFFVVLALNIGGCSNNQVREAISTDTGGIVELRASEQLSAYLRTELPPLDVLNTKIDSMEDKRVREATQTGKLSGGLDTEKTKEFLLLHPEIYVDKTYGGFISSLYSYDEAQNVFDVVSRALFHRKSYPKTVRLVENSDIYENYYTPLLTVESTEDLDYKNTIKNTLLPIKGLTTGIGGGNNKVTGVAYQVLPTTSAQLVVKFYITEELISLPTP